MATLENITSTIKWAEMYIDEYRATGNFNPVAYLTGTESKQQILFGACVEYLQALEEATETFRQAQKRGL